MVVGASAGAIDALQQLLPAIAQAEGPPIVAVVHLSPRGKSVLPEVLARRCPLPVREAEDKQPVASGTVWIAPPNYHLLVEPDRTFSFSVDEPVNFSRPSIDVLFESAADAYGDAVVAVLLTGASADGAAGLARVKLRGGRAIVQDPASAECATMPAAGIAATAVDYVLPLERIGEHLLSLVDGTRV